MSLRQAPTLTPAMLAANRRNAQKSTGPRTEEGKRRVRLNGLMHGWRCGSFRESLIKSGESTALVDRNFLFLILYLMPQRRHEVHRIADFVRLLWSVGHWGRRHEVRAARPERLVQNCTTELQLQALLSAAERRVRELERRRGSGPANLGLQATDAIGPVPSPSEPDLLRRTGPILLPGLAPTKAPARPRLVRSRLERSPEQSRNVTWNQRDRVCAPSIPSPRATGREPQAQPIDKNQRPKPESSVESARSSFAFPPYHPQEQRAGDARAQPIDKNQRPKPESSVESATSILRASYHRQEDLAREGPRSTKAGTDVYKQIQDCRYGDPTMATMGSPAPPGPKRRTSKPPLLCPRSRHRRDDGRTL